ncbi:MAG TPA: hypothetical protein VGM87_25025 [Roseomonas sp.]|jgi:hypothetical protein
MDPDDFARFAWQAGTVFALRSWDLTQNPGQASFRLSEMVIEKQRAFTEGAVAAWWAVMLGSRPDVVADAALRPARRRVSANHRRLMRGL